MNFPGQNLRTGAAAAGLTCGGGLRWLSLSSVTRWLLMVVGCVVLETAQPMSAATPAPAAPEKTLAPDTLLYPTDATAPTTDSAPGGGAGTWLFALVVFCSVGAFFYWKKNRASTFGATSGGLVVEETRALGNRQFLIVAACHGQRFLLGVAPGRIQMLAPLDGKDPSHDRPAA